jgi:glycosyltransferase involved in cell wall biosynthesis
VGLTLGVQETGGILRQALEIGAWILRESDIELVPIGSRANIDRLAEMAGRAPVTEVVVPTQRGSIEVLWIRYALGAQLARAGVDLLHCTKHILPRRAEVPVVLTVHDFVLLDRPEDYGTAKAKLLPPLYRRSIAEADRWIAVSDTVADDLARRFHVPADRITTINPGSSSLAEVTPEPMDDVSQPFALVLGDLSPRKNVAFLARLWAEVHERTGMLLIAAGPEGWRSEQARAALDGLQRAGLGRWVGRVTDGQVRWLYEHASVVCVPSLAEGYGLAVVEAASLGCPVVSSEIPSLREGQGGAVTVVPVTDVDGWVEAIVAAARRPDRPRPFRAQGWDDAARLTVQLYDEVLSASPARAASHRGS